MAKLRHFNVPVDVLLLMHFQQTLRSKKPHKTKKKHRQGDRVSTSLAHFDLDNLGKQDTSLNI